MTPANVEAKSLALMMQATAARSWKSSGELNLGKNKLVSKTATWDNKYKTDNIHLPKRGDAVSYFMLKTLAKELAFPASSVMSLHRWWKYIETAISLHVWTL